MMALINILADAGSKFAEFIAFAIFIAFTIIVQLVRKNFSKGEDASDSSSLPTRTVDDIVRELRGTPQYSNASLPEPPPVHARKTKDLTPPINCGDDYKNTVEEAALKSVQQVQTFNTVKNTETLAQQQMEHLQQQEGEVERVLQEDINVSPAMVTNQESRRQKQRQQNSSLYELLHNNNDLRKLILAQEILGKPLSMR